jgi:hypothetical protein
MKVKETLRLRKNPFPVVAHAGSLGRELLAVTVKTGNFDEMLKSISMKSMASEPLALILTGPAGAGKTHFLKYVQYSYEEYGSRHHLAVREDEQESREQPIPFDRIVYLEGPGTNFSEFVSLFFDSAFDEKSLQEVFDRLIAEPVIKLCRTKAERDEDREINTKICDILLKEPARVHDYWSRFNKSEIFDSVEKFVEQISKHQPFRDAFLRIVRSVRDGQSEGTSQLRGQLRNLISWNLVHSGREAGVEQQIESVHIMESILGLFNLIRIRLLLLVDESQQLLKEKDKDNLNKFFRDVINATPRQSVMIFALRTEHWEEFRDEATQRRVLYFKLSVTEEEAKDILHRFILAKGEVRDVGQKELSEFFPRSAVHDVWLAGDRVVGKILTLSYQVIQLVMLSDWKLSVEQAVKQLATSRRLLDSGEQASQEVRDILVQLLETTPFHVERHLDIEQHEFDLAVFEDQNAPYPLLLIQVLSARDDVEEAENVLGLASSIMRIRRRLPFVRFMTVVLGYSSTEVWRILKQASDSAFKFNQDHILLRQLIRDSVARETRLGINKSLRRENLADDLRRVDVLTGLLRERTGEQKRLWLTRLVPYLGPTRGKSWYTVSLAGLLLSLLGIEPVWLLLIHKTEPIYISYQNLTSISSLDSVGRNLSLKVTYEMERLRDLPAYESRNSLSSSAGTNRSSSSDTQLTLFELPSNFTLADEQKSENFWTRWNRWMFRLPRKLVQIHLYSTGNQRLMARLTFVGFSQTHRDLDLPVYIPKDESGSPVITILATAIGWEIGDSDCKSFDAFLELVDILEARSSSAGAAVPASIPSAIKIYCGPRSQSLLNAIPMWREQK